VTHCGLGSLPIDVEAASRGAGMQIVKPLIEKNEQNFPHARWSLLEMLGDAVERDLGSLAGRVAVGAGADGGKADGARATLLSQFQAFAIATGQLGGFAMAAILVDGADSVNYMQGGKRAGGGHDRAPRRTTSGAGADLIQLAHDPGAACAMNGAIHSTAPAQSGVSCIHDGVDAYLGDVTDHETEFLPVREINLHDL